MKNSVTINMALIDYDVMRWVNSTQLIELININTVSAGTIFIERATATNEIYPSFHSVCSFRLV